MESIEYPDMNLEKRERSTYTSKEMKTAIPESEVVIPYAVF